MDDLLHYNTTDCLNGKLDLKAWGYKSVSACEYVWFRKTNWSYQV